MTTTRLSIDVCACVTNLSNSKKKKRARATCGFLRETPLTESERSGSFFAGGRAGEGFAAAAALVFVQPPPTPLPPTLTHPRPSWSCCLVDVKKTPPLPQVFFSPNLTSGIGGAFSGSAISPPLSCPPTCWPHLMRWSGSRSCEGIWFGFVFWRGALGTGRIAGRRRRTARRRCAVSSAQRSP